ncbi:hypothetical protein K2X85_10335 [bacterium]|nr:hypothetical protein [bacterium]
MHRQQIYGAARRFAWSALLAASMGATGMGSAIGADRDQERQLVQRLAAPGSDEERLRSIDAVILSKESGLELRSALRRMSINDPSAEVRGAARFALVKLQAMAPPTVSPPCECVEKTPPTAGLRNWKPKESVEQVNEPIVDSEVIPTKGPLTKLGEQLGIRRAVQESPEVVVVEMKPVDAARITAVATTGNEVAREEAGIRMSAIPIPTANTRTLPPMENKTLPTETAPVGVLSQIQQKLQKAPASPALEPLAASDKLPQKEPAVEEKGSRVPVPTIMQARQEVVPTPAMSSTASSDKSLNQPRLSTIAWPRIPPQANSTENSASMPEGIRFGSIPQPTPLSPTAPPAVAKSVASQAAGAPANGPVPPKPPAGAMPVAVPTKPAAPPVTVTAMKPAAPSAVVPAQMTPQAPVAAAQVPPMPALTQNEVPFVARTKPQIELAEIPTGSSARQQMARELLDRGRTLARSGQWAEAESVLFRLRELAVEYRRFSYSPEDLEREITAARQKERLAGNNNAG